MWPPERIGVGDAWLFFLWIFPGLDRLNTSTSRICRPVSTSRQITRRDLPPSVAVVSQMRPPAMTGEDHPFPRMGTFHWMFRDELLHFSGRLFTSA